MSTRRLSPEVLQDLQSKLRARADELRREIAETDAERTEAIAITPTDTVEDAGERGEERSRDAVRQAEEDRDAGELGQVEAALARIDAGHYGVCVDCGAAIPLRRLRVQPAAMRCIDCQRRAERAPGAEHRGG